MGVFGDLSPEVAETYRLLGEADLEQGNLGGAHRKLSKVRLEGRCCRGRASLLPPLGRSPPSILSGAF